MFTSSKNGQALIVEVPRGVVQQWLALGEQVRVYRDGALVEATTTKHLAELSGIAPAGLALESLRVGRTRADRTSIMAKSNGCDDCSALEMQCKNDCDARWCEFGTCREPNYFECAAECDAGWVACASAGTCDFDSDGVFGNADNCVFVANADQANCDNDLRGNVCDELNGIYEVVVSTVPAICHIDEDGWAPIYYKLERYDNRLLRDISSCRSPNRRERFLADEGTYINMSTYSACASITRGLTIPWCTYKYNQDHCGN